MISETILVSDIISLFIIVFLVRNKINKDYLDFLGFHKMKAHVFVLWLLIIIGLYFLTDYISKYADISEPEFMKFMREILATDSLLNLILLFLAVGVAAPLFEEIMFRGFMYNGIIRSKAGLAGAIIIPALIWSLVHLQYEWIWIAIVFLMGILFGLARYLTGSIYTVIGMHALNNILSITNIII